MTEMRQEEDGMGVVLWMCLRMAGKNCIPPTYTLMPLAEYPHLLYCALHVKRLGCVCV
jgi:hypothetical protein